jgi:hypothetical protein
MKMRIPLILGFIAGTFFLVQFFVPHAYLQTVYDMVVQDWLLVLGVFVFVLGMGSFFRTHLDRIRERRPEAPYSVIAILSFAAMATLGLGWGTDPGSPFQWVFRWVQTPLDATVFSLLAFFMASAAYRSFRARSVEATILLITAVIVIIGRVPIGSMITHYWPEATEWIMYFPTVGVKRAIGFGVALGVIATSLRIILGIERSHLGGE